MTFSRRELEQIAASVPFWFHSISLGSEVVTPGWRSAADLAREVEELALPDLAGKTVLDINTWDGFFAFEAERRGAQRVVALDRYMWSMDLAEHQRYCRECAQRGLVPSAYHSMPYYQPDRLPGKGGFDAAHWALGSRVEVTVEDFMETDLESLGMFDVVFFLGSLYHMEDPLLALRRVFAVTRGIAIIESEAAEFRGVGDRALCEFFASNELRGDISNWWAPNERALAGLCRAAGFANVRVMSGASTVRRSGGPRRGGSMKAIARQAIHRWRRLTTGVTRYRAVVHASR